MLEYVTTPVVITMGACIVSYFWGKYQINTDEIREVCIEATLDTLRDEGYIKTKIAENGEEEIIKLDD